MEDEKRLEKIRQVLKKSHGEPSKFMELITCILDMNREGEIASYPKIIRELWPEDWKEAEDKVEFEKVKWDLLCKRRREISDRLLNSDMCFEFFIELSGEKQFNIITDPKEIYARRLKELERNLARTKLKNVAEKIETSRIVLNDKFKEFEEGRVRPRNAKWKRAAVFIVAVLVVAAAAVVAIRKYYFPNPPAIEPASIERMAYPLPDKPSIAVLPFTNMSDDPGQEYLVDGITENIITSLSKVPRLFVIARNSTFTYKGKAVKIQKVCEDLGVRYVLGGSVQKSGDRLRISAQLVDGTKGQHLWSDRYDRELKDIFALQDEITMKILTALQVKLTEGEEAHVHAKGTKNLEAYLKFLEGNYYWFQRTPDDNVRARPLAEEAIALDPAYPHGYILLAVPPPVKDEPTHRR